MWWWWFSDDGYGGGYSNGEDNDGFDDGDNYDDGGVNRGFGGDGFVKIEFEGFLRYLIDVFLSIYSYRFWVVYGG